jgi:hypothetical protein
MSNTVTRIYVECLPAGRRGLMYRARHGSPDGPVLVERSTEPLLAASRALMAMGITGAVEMWDVFRAFPRMKGDIEKLAKLTVREDKAAFVRWKPFAVARSAEISTNAGAGLPEAREDEAAVLEPTATKTSVATAATDGKLLAPEVFAPADFSGGQRPIVS